MKNISKWAILSPVIYPMIGLGMLIAAKIFAGGDATIVLSLALPSCALLAFQFSRNSISEETWLPFLWMIRGILSIPGSYHCHYWWTAPKVLASDGDVVSKNVTIRRGIQYGPMSLHVMDRISYAHQTDENKKNAVVYIHGGGFIVCRSEHTSHGAVPFVRNSKFQTAYSLDYPYCPEHRFPVPLLSVIQAIVYLHEEMQIENVLLVGESSGGLLATTAAAAIMNRKDILNPILNACDQDLLELTCPSVDLDTKFPKISGVVSICGIHDESAWRKSLDSKSNIFHRLEWSLVQYALTFSLNCFRNAVAKKSPSLLRCTIVSMLENVSNFQYADTMFVCAECDPLTKSAKRAHDLLIKNSVHSELTIYKNQHHGFYGLPMQWRDPSYVLQYFIPTCLRNWMSRGRGMPVVQRTTYDIIEFVKNIK
eukprot:g1089.t1